MSSCPGRNRFAIALWACLLSTSGCATLTLAPQFAAEAAPEQEKAADPEGPYFVVDIRPEGKDAQSYRLPVPPEGIFVDDVLKKSGVIKRFGRVEIELWRPGTGPMGYFKLDIPYDRRKRGVPSAYNYAVYAGDRLQLIEDTSTVFDDTMEALLGPLGLHPRKKP